MPRNQGEELSASGVHLQALLNAYDDEQKGMPEEEKKAMNERVLSKEESFTVDQEEAGQRRAAVRVSELFEKPVGDAAKDVESLEDAANESGSESLNRLVDLLKRKED